MSYNNVHTKPSFNVRDPYTVFYLCFSSKTAWSTFFRKRVRLPLKWGQNQQLHPPLWCQERTARCDGTPWLCFFFLQQNAKYLFRSSASLTQTGPKWRPVFWPCQVCQQRGFSLQNQIKVVVWKRRECRGLCALQAFQFGCRGEGHKGKGENEMLPGSLKATTGFRCL